MHWFELGLLDLVHQRQVRVDGTAHAVGVRELVGDAVALAPDRGDEVLARDQALDFVAEGQLVRRVGLLARRPRVELAYVCESGSDGSDSRSLTWLIVSVTSREFLLLSVGNS